MKKLTSLSTVKEPFPGAETASIEEWNDYLEQFETPRREVLLKPNQYDQLAERETIKCTYENLEYRESDFDISERVHKALAQLTKKEREVIKLIYWKNYFKTSVAKKLGISRQAVQCFEHKALEKLKKYFSENDQENLAVTIVRGLAG